MIDFDIVIITLNEEENISKLLESIRDQEILPKKIIVADADSTDDTVKIAKRFGCKIVPGGNTPAQGRNIGFEFVKSEWVLFLDGDVVLPKGFIKKCLEYIKDKKLDVASVNIKPNTSLLIDRVLLGVYNVIQDITQYFWAHGIGACIFCKKTFFRRIKRFDDSVKLAEDQEFIKRAAKKGKYRIIPKTYILFSMRRFEKEGRVLMVLENIFGFFYRLFFGEIRKKNVQRKIGYLKRKEWLKNKK